VPSFTIFMRDEIFKVLEEITRKEGMSRGAVLSEALIKYAGKKGIHTEGKALRARVRE